MVFMFVIWSWTQYRSSDNIYQDFVSQITV